MTSQTRRGRSELFGELLSVMSLPCQMGMKQLKTRLMCSGVRLHTCDVDSSARGATCRQTFITRRYCSLYAAMILMFVVLVSPAAANAPPRFVMNGESEIVLRLKEGPQTPVGSVLYRLRGYDPDGDRLKFAVRGQVGSRLLEVIQVSDTEADVILKRPLDREMVDEYSIILTLTDGRLNDNFVTQSMLLLVDDVNDNRPIFLPHESTLVVSEDAAPHVLAVLEATDRDEGPFGQVVYRLYPPSVEDVFSVSTQDGQAVLRLSGSLDYERQPFYQLQLLAIDRAAQSPHTATAALLVNVEDAADTPVEFVFVPPVARIPEDIAVGSQVTRVLAIDGDRGVNAATEYTLQGGGGLFNIDQSSGIIVTAAALDREARIQTNGAYVLTIGAREKGSNVEFVYTEVSVILTDVNDQTPQFASDIYTAELSEDSQQGLPLLLSGAARPMVFDYDQGTNGTFRLSLEDAGGIFEISPPEGVNVAEFMIRVANSSALDYESVAEYNFTVVATEVASLRQSRAHVVVYILDANDNSPLFELPKYSVDVSESATAGSAVAWIKASDVDTGRFGTAGIRFNSITGDIADSLSLDPMSGKITIATSDHGMDRETSSRHQLSVVAQDDLGRGNRNLVHLEINVVDSNDNAPRCEQSDQRVTIAENAITFPNHPLLVKASDDDQAGTVNSQLWFRVVGDAGGNFTIDAITGELRLRTGLDFEALDGEGDVRLLNVTVAVSDRGDPPLSATCVVRVLVRDVNDVAPRFDKFLYRKSLPEDSPGGTRVIQVSAIDGDGSTQNSLVVYRIQHGAQDKFVIDSDSGLISVSEGASLDPDLSQPRTTVYNLTVWALDGGVGGGQLFDTTSVIIVIQDVNNKSPMFVDPGLAYIAENARVGSVVKQLRAVDPDENPLLRYSIDHNLGEARNEQGALVRATEYNFTAAFQVHPIKGLVRTARTLDRELVETVRMVLKVEDLAAMNFRQSATVTLTIHLEDVNDHSPVFRQPYYRRAVMENASPGTAVASVVADDVDLNRTIFYSLHGPQTVTGLVFLDKETGEIVVSKKIDYELFHWLNFTVRATDSGVPSRTGHTEVYVQVLDENDNNPRFVDHETEVTVREDAPIGTPVVQVQAVDEDSGDYGKLTYRIDRRSSNGKFHIDPDSGEVSVLSELNREEQSTYSLIIQVWDNYQFGFTSGESRNAFKHITVTLADVNDETPRLQVTEDCVTVTEFHDPRDVITVVTAEDLDDPDSLNSRISFSILSGNHNGLFAVQAVDNNSANILATRRLVGDYGNYTLTVQAADGGYPSNKEERDLYICVTDFNDHSPRFIQPANFSIRIPENATVGTDVVYVLAEDEDIGINGAVRYRLRQDLLGNFRTFHVDETTGLLRLRQPLDRERQKVYELRVEAFDLGIPTSLSSVLDLTIFVSDVNDFQPQFLVDTFSVNFTEHRAPGSEKRRLVSTVDRDDPEDDHSKVPPVCYFIVGGNTGGIFTVDSLQHDIMTIKPLDREEHAIHELIIKASEDCQVKPDPVPFFLQDDDTLLKLIVFVDDINDNRPEFERQLFSGGVTTETDYGTEVMRVQAVDPDWGANARLHYAIQGAIQKTLSEGLDSIGDDPFVLDPETGVVILNFDPQRGMKGYFDFMVSVTDISGEGDTARVFIYLLREDQRIKFVLRMKPQEARKKSNVLRDALDDVSGSIVNIDEYKVHQTAAGGVDRTKTDMYLHLVDKQDHSILDVHTALALLDRNVERLDPVFKELNVLSTEAAEDGTRRPGVRVAAIGWLVGICAALLVLLAVVVFICANQRAKYKRMLRATTAAAFGSSATQGTRSTTVPNTNIHAVEGSNPVWMTGYGHDWYKPGLEVTSMPTSQDTEDGMNGDCQDSLDENAVNGGDSLIISNHQQLSNRTTHSSVNYNMYHNQNKSSRNGRSNGAVVDARPNYHQNILSCTARVASIDKQLAETTEL